MRVIEAHMTVRDEKDEIVEGFSEYRIQLNCPDDWDDLRVREELDDVTNAVERIMGA